MLSVREHYREAYSLGELVQTSRKVLSKLEKVADRRVNQLPDARTIRYYQTIGLLSKPLHYKGRQAIYGYSHLVQLTCVKLLQLEGHPLALIQKALLGRSIKELESKLEQLLPAEENSVEEPVGVPGRTLESVELASGITIVIDPAKIRRPRELLEAIGKTIKDFL